MKHLQTYRLFEASAAASAPVKLTKEQTDWLDKCTDGNWKLSPQTGLVDVDGSFDCSRQRLSDFKGVKFGVVEGRFSCGDNQLESLVGAPQRVGGDFDCSENQLESLEGAPQKVGDFNCGNNQLKSLEGAPQKVGS